ncbi:MAG: AAA family ATPase, partial [Proteobacteria bacterium]|nr:AAA family ATPase [Pseudomonadota bacterium]
KMTVKIKTINIHAFRGIPDLELQLDGKNLLLRGENGTGKSSIVEAIEFFFTGKISHLEGTKGLSLQRHAPHVNFDPDDLNVELTFNPDSVSLNRTFGVSPSPPEQFKDYFQITQKGIFILRRSQILTFIISKPADRFREIGSIIGVEPLDEIELEMKRVRDNLKGEMDSKEEKISGLISDLSTIIEKDITRVED